MRSRGRLVVALWLGFACGESNAPQHPATVAVDGGDGQFAFFGGTLPAPLTARVTTSAGQGYPGVIVTWSVTAGSATLGASADTTDATGRASTTVTVGNQAGPITIQAAPAGLPTVSFKASACDLPAFTLGDTLTGALSTADCKAAGHYTDFYTLDLTVAQQGITIFDSAATFDAYLDLYAASGARVAFHDDIQLGVIQHSLIHAIVAPGEYIFAPSSFDADTTGSYTVSVVSRPQTLAGCQDVWVTRGVTVTDSVTTEDCVAGGPYYGDIVSIHVAGGSVLTIAERSTAFDAYVELYLDPGPDQNLVFITANDDSAGIASDAYLTVTAPLTAKYIVFAATADTGETGAYTLAIAASAPAAAVPLTASPFSRGRSAWARLPKAAPLPGSRWLR